MYNKEITDLLKKKDDLWYELDKLNIKISNLKNIFKLNISNIFTIGYKTEIISSSANYTYTMEIKDIEGDTFSVILSNGGNSVIDKVSRLQFMNTIENGNEKEFKYLCDLYERNESLSKIINTWEETQLK